ncbi:MAG: enoyl-CoA hydratase [Hyphomicrobiales bacterium]
MDVLVKERTGAVLRLTLNRPQSRNALSLDLLHALADAVRAAEVDGSTRVVVLQGAPPAFSAGHDLSEIRAHMNDADHGRAFNERLFRTCSDLMLAIRRSPLPFIAAVNGVATAAGCQLVATCDLAVAGESARFGVNGVNVGLFCSTPMVALSRAVPQKLALDLLTTGRLMSAPEALAAGLVNRVVADTAVEATADEIAATLLAKSPEVLALGKRAFYRQAELDEAAAYDYAAGVIVDNLALPAAQDGIAAFVDRKGSPDRGR